MFVQLVIAGEALEAIFCYYRLRLESASACVGRHDCVCAGSPVVTSAREQSNLESGEVVATLSMEYDNRHRLMCVRQYTTNHNW